MKLYKLTLLFVIGLISIQRNMLAQSLIVQTKYGKVEGYKEEDIRIYKGIPFAAPPVGNLRWKAPQAPAPWKDVKKCLAFSASPAQPKPVPFLCWTAEFIAPPAPLSEDCLYLNVWTGAASNKEKRPVFVWIYGGAFSSGSTACAIYDGAAYAKKGIVFVSINYRVGALGFMAHPALTKEGNGVSGNYGLMDQVAALKWVQENIAAFGGDPSNVTIGGQSAGAMSVNALIASPAAKGLFQRAIAESGGLLGGIKLDDLAEEEKSGTDLQGKLGAKNIEAMRALPADSIVRISQGMGNLRFAPVRDGKFLPVDIDKAFSEGKFNHVDFIGGWVTGDGTLFGVPKVTPEGFIKSVNEGYGSKAAKLLVVLPHENAEQASNSLQTLNLISFGVLSPYRFSKYNAKPNYIYEFSHVPVEKPGFPDYGAFHTSEVPYALHTLHEWERPWKPVDISLEDNMSSYWINFIRTGNPNGASLPEWKTYHTGVTLELGDSIQGKINLYKDILEVLTGE
jgi:para-nitrobenzyl esterase